MASNIKLLCFGSINLDTFAYCSKLPEKGETIVADSIDVSYGGKGANQAVQAAKLFQPNDTGHVALCGCIGQDGLKYINYLQQEKVDATYIDILSKELTGSAYITVNNKNGENTIVVAPGANQYVSLNRFRVMNEFDKTVLNSKVLLLQNEIPLETVMSFLRWMKSLNEHPFIIYNPAPTNFNLPLEYYKIPNLLIFNEVEAQQLCIEYRQSNQVYYDKIFLINTLHSLLGEENSIIITFGSKGAYVKTPTNNGLKIACHKIPSDLVIDTTGAGDSFVGALGFYISEDCRSLEDCIKEAQYVAGMSILKRGASASYVSIEEVEKYKRSNKLY